MKTANITNTKTFLDLAVIFDILKYDLNRKSILQKSK